ncbi:lipoprotein [uncultured Oceanicoccus sp.]|uniref:LPS translocon maturation chaperone LptM n=1 Tax=uncultured Oceanicoccus sp. TaxID=1706381 RepID=UPI0030D9CC0A
MQTPKNAILIKAALLTSLLMLTACGQKGPLYLPQDPNVVSEDTTSTAVSAETASKKDNNLAPAPSDSQD